MKTFYLVMRLCWGDIEDGGCSDALFISETQYEDFALCMIDGHSKSIDGYLNLGRDNINTQEIRFEFHCEEKPLDQVVL